MERLPVMQQLVLVLRQPVLHVEAALRLMLSVKQSDIALKNCSQFPKAPIWD